MSEKLAKYLGKVRSVTSKEGHVSLKKEDGSKVAGYIHFFERYVEDENGQKIDRLKQVLEHGIVSPKRAKSLGIPFVEACTFTIDEVENEDDVIFLYPIKDANNVPAWNQNVTIFLSPDVDILNFKEMNKLQKGCWIAGSMGEVYRFGEIDPKFFRGIALPYDESVEEVAGMIKNLQPSLVDQIKIIKP